MMKKKDGRSDSKRPVLEGLEPRLLFSADALKGIAPNGLPDMDGGFDRDAFDYAERDPGGDYQEAQADSTTWEGRELVLIDNNVEDYQQLVDDLLAGAGADGLLQVVVLDGEANGIDQITDVLGSYSDLDAVHLISHGSGNGLQLGDTWLDSNSLGSYQEKIGHWSEALSEDADLLIYGCDLASTADGESLVDC
jgi:hypothetical protein